MQEHHLVARRRHRSPMIASGKFDQIDFRCRLPHRDVVRWAWVSMSKCQSGRASQDEAQDEQPPSTGDLPQILSRKPWPTLPGLAPAGRGLPLAEGDIAWRMSLGWAILAGNRRGVAVTGGLAG